MLKTKQNTFKRKINDNTISVLMDKIKNADWSSVIQEPVSKFAFNSFDRKSFILSPFLLYKEKNLNMLHLLNHGLQKHCWF